MKLRSYILAGLAVIITAGLAAQAQVPGTNSTLQSIFNLVYEPSTSKATYSSFVSLSQGQIASNPTDVCMMGGSATKTLRVRRVMFGLSANAVITEPVAILKRSTAPTGGTAGQVGVIVPYDSNFAASTVVVDVYTANPTVGTLVGVLADVLVTANNYTTGVGTPFYTYDFGRAASPVFLRGVNQSITVNLGAISVTNGTLICGFEWTEDNDA